MFSWVSEDILGIVLFVQKIFQVQCWGSIGNCLSCFRTWAARLAATACRFGYITSQPSACWETWSCNILPLRPWCTQWCAQLWAWALVLARGGAGAASFEGAETDVLSCRWRKSILSNICAQGSRSSFKQLASPRWCHPSRPQIRTCRECGRSRNCCSPYLGFLTRLKLSWHKFKTLNRSPSRKEQVPLVSPRRSPTPMVMISITTSALMMPRGSVCYI